MKKIDEVIDELLEIIHDIKEQLFGFGYEDFRTNRKLKIDITDKILNLIDIYDSNINNFNDIIPAENKNEIENIKNQLLKNEAGIDTQLLWNICKMNLNKYEKGILKYKKDEISLN